MRSKDSCRTSRIGTKSCAIRRLAVPKTSFSAWSRSTSTSCSSRKPTPTMSVPAARNQTPHLLVDPPVRLAVEVVAADHLYDPGDGVPLQEHRAQDALLGLGALWGNPLQWHNPHGLPPGQRLPILSNKCLPVSRGVSRADPPFELVGNPVDSLVGNVVIYHKIRGISGGQPGGGLAAPV